MTATPLHNAPTFNDVVREQFKATAHALNLPAIIAAALTVNATMIALADFFRGHGGVEFSPDMSMIPAFAGIVLAIIVWHRQKQFGAGFFWTLPVDRSSHAFARVLAGWFCLMIGAAIFLAWLLILALITKGN